MATQSLFEQALGATFSPCTPNSRFFGIGRSSGVFARYPCTGLLLAFRCRAGRRARPPQALGCEDASSPPGASSTVPRTPRGHRCRPGSPSSPTRSVRAGKIYPRIGAEWAQQSAGRGPGRLYPDVYGQGGITPVHATGDGDVCLLHIVRTTYWPPLQRPLETLGIDSGVHSAVPDHREPALPDLQFRTSTLEDTEAAVPEIVTVPCLPELPDVEVARAVGALRTVTNSSRLAIS